VTELFLGSDPTPRLATLETPIFTDIDNSKTQVTVEYKHDNGAVIPLRVDTVVISAQHSEDITVEKLRSELMEKIVNKVIPENMRDDKTTYHVCVGQLFNHSSKLT